nr:hypothetical protein GCM10020092_106540 [Actinoplanes digitatis]
MFTDPSYDEYSEASERSRVTLYNSANKVLKAQWRTDWEGKGPEFSAKIKKKRAGTGWRSTLGGTGPASRTRLTCSRRAPRRSSG